VRRFGKEEIEVIFESRREEEVAADPARGLFIHMATRVNVENGIRKANRCTGVITGRHHGLR
jgi:hypothetical protein